MKLLTAPIRGSRNSSTCMSAGAELQEAYKVGLEARALHRRKGRVDHGEGCFGVGLRRRRIQDAKEVGERECCVSAQAHSCELTSVEAVSVSASTPCLIPSVRLEIFQLAEHGRAAVEVLLPDS